jgi:hypothetical protein
MMGGASPFSVYCGTVSRSVRRPRLKVSRRPRVQESWTKRPAVLPSAFPNVRFARRGSRLFETTR